MKSSTMTSMERVLTTLMHKEPDRVPLFLFATMHGAKELGISIEEYFSKSDNVVEGQLRIRKKYNNDCIYAFYYAAIEIEAFGGTVIFSEDGPPNAGSPFIRNFDTISNLQPPKINDAKPLLKVLSSIQKLKESVKEDVPIIGVVMSPFSLPVMQLGFDKYFDLMYFHEDLFDSLMKVNEEFCVNWANSQLEAGATAICYFDPVSSPTIIPRDKYIKTGFNIAKRTLSRIKGPTATHFASGNSLPIIDDIIQTGTAIVSASTFEDISLIKKACGNKLTVLGNLNGVEMRRWTKESAHQNVRDLIRQAAPGGGFILSDNHGEIPFQVPDEVLLSITEAVNVYGKYPMI